MKIASVSLIVLVLGVSWWWSRGTADQVSSMITNPVSAQPSYSDSEPGFDASPMPELITTVRVGRGVGYTITELAAWERPVGPPRVGIQSGHWDNDQVPDELRGLIGNTGAQVGVITERAVVRRISELVKAELEAAGVLVDLLPTVVPPAYVADAFVSIHADGNRDTSIRGFKIAPPRRDYSGQSAALVAALYESYGAVTALPTDSAITNRMTAYYAFNWPRYEHAIHPRTPAAIVETGFLTNLTDRTLLIDDPEQVAEGVVQGVLAFLRSDRRVEPTPLPLLTPELPLTGELICAPLRAERISRAQQTDECTFAIAQSDRPPIALALSGDDPLLEVLTKRLGEMITVSGTYVPIQTLDNYFWFRYEVLGLLTSVTASNI